MSTADNGGPAFPTDTEIDRCHFYEEGMSLRDYFAAKAAQGMMSEYDEHWDSVEKIAQVAYSLADAMLVERDKVKP